jgi:hypothetical protein
MTQPRRWFQISLLEALILMVLCSIILGLNLTVRRTQQNDGTMYEWGFPISSLEQYYPDANERITIAILNSVGFSIVVSLYLFIRHFLIRRGAKQ